MSLIKRLTNLSIQVLILALGLEVGASYILGNKVLPPRDLTDYSENELDESLPFIADNNGNSCIEIKAGFNWNQWWGYSSKELDLRCAKRFFSNETYNVVFMGGSAMYNAEAPNHLTSIEYIATKNFRNVRSLNLAESGARHMNMSVRFQREVLPLSPDLVIFFDGFNEFNSIVYGGKPGDDFYWTAGGKYRMHFPFRLYIDKAIELSDFLELALVHTGIYKSSRNVIVVEFDNETVFDATSAYLNDKSVTNALCERYGIKCLFIIQPQVFGSLLDEHIDIINITALQFPHAEEMRVHGYNLILDGCKDCIDMSKELHNIPRSFHDQVHFGKAGSRVIGENFAKLIEENMGFRE